MHTIRYFARLARLGILFAGFVAASAASAAGTIDTSFASGVARVGGEAAQGPGAVLVRPDGRIFYAARRFDGSAIVIGARKRNGAVDNVFNNGGFGYLTTSGTAYGPRLANDPLSGRILVGYTNYQGGVYRVVLCRLFDTGAIDTSFTIGGYAGQTGCVSTNPPAGAPNGLILAGIDVWSNGTIILGGTAYNYSATAIGKPFDGFLSAGGSLNYSILPVPGDYTINAIASVEGTDVRYFGGTNIVQPGDFAGVVIRATTSSSLSATFNINLAPPGIDDVRALLRMPNTSTIVAVATVDASPQVTTCMLYSMSQFDLTPDVGFGPNQDGRRYLHLGASSDSSRCDALAADGTGALFVGGMLNLANTDLMAVARVSPAGQLDANYGAGGVALFNTRALFGPTYDERVFALGVQNGRAIAAGPSAPVASPTPANTDMVIVRLSDDDRLFVGDFE